MNELREAGVHVRDVRPEAVLKVVEWTGNGKVVEFIESATKYEEGVNISTVDLLFAYNGWTKERLIKNVFTKALKETYRLTMRKMDNGRSTLHLANRNWNENFQ